MAEQGTTTETLTRGRTGEYRPAYDSEAIERSPEFQELVRRRRAIVVPATIFYLAWYMGFILLCGYAQDFMSERVYQGLTVGYCLALTQFLMVFGLGIFYLRRSERVLDPLRRRVVDLAEPTAPPRGGRFEREQVTHGEALR
jgi:uncharacterized membrane protein (DUF485 family)